MKRNCAKIINKSELMHLLKMEGPVGWLLTTAVMSLLGINKVNRLYDKVNDKQGPEFSDGVLKALGVTCDIKQKQLEHIPLNSSFITISNHSYGSIDGLILSSVIGMMRPDYKILTNFILSNIKNLSDTFLPVNPFTDGSVNRSSLKGLRMAKTLLAEGGALGLFPAGEVATYQKGDKKSSLQEGRVLEDIPWSPNMIKLIAGANVPVIPIYFDGYNSKLFHFVGRIHPMLRTTMLIWELLNKKGRCVPMRIGKAITPSEIAEFKDLKLLGGYLRSRVYALESEFKVNSALSATVQIPETLAIPRDKKAVLKEFDKIKKGLLFESAQFRCYLAEYDEIPNIITEIGRRREEAFRATGEGSNKSLDLDEYDKYYKHLILFDTKCKKIAGAYRLGIGREIFEKHGGVSGFYSASLFKYKDGFRPYMEDSIELGRSFVSVEYQKEALPLMLLLKGLMYSLMMYQDAKYFIGPVSISNWYPKLYQSLMVKYISERHTIDSLKDLIVPATPFTPDFGRVNPDMLLQGKCDSFEKFDRFLMRLSDNQYRVPTLVKKYIKINARIICFNVDPMFNYSLDGLIMLKLTDFPKQELLSLMRDVPQVNKREEILGRFGYSLK